MKLTWKRDPYSGWWAYGQDLGYQLLREDRIWLLNVRRVVETAGVRHTLGQDIIYELRVRFDTLPEAKAVVQNFEDDPRNDMHNAKMKYYDEIVKPKLDAIVAEYDAMIANRQS